MDYTRLVGELTTTFSPTVTSDERDMALNLLAGLKVRDDAWTPPTAYSRQLVVYMPKFAQLGLDMKDYILARDLVDRVYDSDGFTLRYAKLRQCPYSGTPVEFTQTNNRAEFLIHIDHIVAVGDAWNSGGYQWSPKGRNWQQLCNDPANLLAVSRAANASKADRNAALWLPTNPICDFQQRFVVLQIGVKARYRLSVTESEKTVMQTVLETSN